MDGDDMRGCGWCKEGGELGGWPPFPQAQSAQLQEAAEASCHTCCYSINDSNSQTASNC
jgi:hypothetical protein